MNVVILGLTFLSAEYISSEYTDSTCAIAQCLFSYTDKQGFKEYPLVVRAWGGNACNLVALQEHDRVLVTGKIWTGHKDKPTWIECKSLVIGYIGNDNQIHIVGRQGINPDIKFFDSGSAVTRTTIAINRTVTETYWYSVDGWNKQSETLQNYGRKGELLGVEGKLEINQWVDTVSRETKQTLKIIANRFELLSSNLQGAAA